MSQPVPIGLAMFDSATTLLRAHAASLHGRDFPALGQSKLLEWPVRFANLLPRAVRRQLFARLGAREGVFPENISAVDAENVAHWAANLYPRRRYPAVMIGSSSGGLVHIGAALGIPWLPQTFLTLVRCQSQDPDDAVAAFEANRETAQRFLAANGGVQLHRMHDPNQDRLMLRHVAYFRSKFRTLPVAYDSFIRTCLEPGGTVVVSECTLDWPTTRIGDRHVYQFGALGGASQQDYFAGGARVKAYLAREGVRRDRWDPPKPDGRSPEAEWGFEPSLLHDVERLARENGYRVLRLVFADPEHLSPLVADLHADWYERRGLDAKRLIVESFVLIDPYRVLRTGAVPFWMTFNMQPSFDFLQNYVSRAGPFEDIHLGLFAHGVESVGLPPIDAWRGILTQARQEGSFLGVSPSAYPAHFSTFARYHIDLRKIAIRSEIGAPMPLAWFERFVHDSADPDLVRLEKAF